MPSPLTSIFGFPSSDKSSFLLSLTIPVSSRILGTGRAPLGLNSLAPWAEGLIVTGMVYFRRLFVLAEMNLIGVSAFVGSGLIDDYQAAVKAQQWHN